MIWEQVGLCIGQPILCLGLRLDVLLAAEVLGLLGLRLAVSSRQGPHGAHFFHAEHLIVIVIGPVVVVIVVVHVHVDIVLVAFAVHVHLRARLAVLLFCVHGHRQRHGGRVGVA